MILQQTPLFGTHRARLAELALARCLPTQDGDREYAKAGGLMDLGGDISMSWYRAATYVHKILKCLEPVLVLHERHLQWLLTEYLRYYQHWHTHRTLDLDCPRPWPA